MKRKISASYSSIIILAGILSLSIIGCSSQNDNNNRDKTPPEILSISPKRNATDVSPSTAITVTFSKNMDAGTVNASSFIVMDGEILKKGTISLNENIAMFRMFRPDEELDFGKTYQVIIKDDVCDLAGNPILSDYSFFFSTGSSSDTTPPQIIATTPTCCDTDVPLNTAMSVTFSEPMDPASLKIIPFKISDGAIEIGGTVTYSGVTASFKPDQNLEHNKTYTATISTNPTDLSGNHLNNALTCSFTTGSEQDTTPPQIIATTPACGATDVSLNTAMSVTFSEPMDPSSLHVIPFKISDGEKDIEGTITYSGVTAYFEPDQDLEPGTTYSATISTNPTDLSGNHLTSELTCSFTTGSAQDTTPPQIIATTPACGATDVSLNTAMSVTFSEPMEPDSLHIIPFKISDGEHEIGGTVTYSGVTAFFNPDEDLVPDTTYSATISTNPTDLSGNHLTSELSCSFTTGSAQDTTPPQIIATTPECGATDISLNTAMTVTFSEPMDPNSLHVIPLKMNDGEKDIGGTVTYSGVTAFFKPDQELEHDTTYSATISTNPTDLSGNHLTSELSCSFTTGATQDTTAPQIIAITPECEATDVPLNTAMTVTFSEPMDPNSLHMIPFVLSDGIKEIGGTVEYSGVVATFIPNESLEYNKTYTGTISTNPTDLAGNHLENSLTCSFSTPSYSELPVIIFNADKNPIEKNETVNLTWNTANADSVSIDNGIGAVESSGSKAVTLTSTTVYTIFASGPAGNSKQSLQIKVNGHPAPLPEDSFGKTYESLIPPDATLDAYDPDKFGIITGFVTDSNNSPLRDVMISIIGYPQYGSTMTDSGGIFYLPIDGGNLFTVKFQKEGLVTAYRYAILPENDVSVVDNLQMMPFSPQSTLVAFDQNPDTIVTHQVTFETSQFGSKSLSIVFQGDNRAFAVDKDGNDLHELKTINIRTTSFDTPQSIPTPPISLFEEVESYFSVEITIDGAEHVRFEKPVVSWLEGPLDLLSGEMMHLGYFNSATGSWEAAGKAILVKLLDTDTDGIVDALDATGDDQADDLNNNGALDDEVMGLTNSSIYKPGAKYWRSTCNHLSVYAYIFTSDSGCSDWEWFCDNSSNNGVHCYDWLGDYSGDRIDWKEISLIKEVALEAKPNPITCINSRVPSVNLEWKVVPKYDYEDMYKDETTYELSYYKDEIKVKKVLDEPTGSFVINPITSTRYRLQVNYKATYPENPIEICFYTIEEVLVNHPQIFVQMWAVVDNQNLYNYISILKGQEIKIYWFAYFATSITLHPEALSTAAPSIRPYFWCVTLSPDKSTTYSIEVENLIGETKTASLTVFVNTDAWEIDSDGDGYSDGMEQNEFNTKPNDINSFPTGEIQDMIKTTTRYSYDAFGRIKRVEYKSASPQIWKCEHLEFTMESNGETGFKANIDNDVNYSVIHPEDLEGCMFTWDFGDNTTAEGQSVSHQYDHSGVFKVVLTATEPGSIDKTCTSSQQLECANPNQ